VAYERSDDSELVFKHWAKQCGIYGSDWLVDVRDC